MNRDNVRNPARSVANVEFHHTGEEVNGIARRIVRALEDRGIRAMYPAMGFPMEQPLQEKRETVYVVPGSDAEAHVTKRFPHKTVKRVRNSLTPISIEGFRNGLSMTFQPGQARNLAATYHVQFSGAEACRFTVVLGDQTCTVQNDLVGQADLLVQGDGATWIAFLRQQRNLLLALLTGRIRLRWNPRLLLRFARCFPV